MAHMVFEVGPKTSTALRPVPSSTYSGLPPSKLDSAETDVTHFKLLTVGVIGVVAHTAKEEAAMVETSSCCETSWAETGQASRKQSRVLTYQFNPVCKLKIQNSFVF